MSRTSYLGSQAEYELEFHDQRLVAVRHDPGEVDLYPQGATVHVQFVRENMYLLPNEE